MGSGAAAAATASSLVCLWEGDGEAGCLCPVSSGPPAPGEQVGDGEPGQQAPGPVPAWLA